MFKNLRFLFIFSVLLFSCSKKEKPTFSIAGTISPTAEYVILKQEIDIERKVSEVVDTITVDENGLFKTSFTTEPYLYSLTFPNKKKIDLAIADGQNLNLSIQGYDTDEFKVTAKGSKDTEALLAYENFRTESLDRLVKSVRREITTLKKAENPDQEKIAELGKLELTNYDKHLDELVVYIQEHMHNTLGLYATSIRWKGAHQLTVFDSLATQFERAHPDLELSKKIREKVDRLQQTAIGGTVTNIDMPNVAGELINLYPIQAEYVLIDFWASWCGPCRRESPVLNELMHTFSRKQFDIFGVSLDDKRDKWLKALEKDNRTWTNVSTLERFKTPAAYDYAVTALPDNYLIDKNGKIVAKNLHGEELLALVSELLSKK